MSARADPPVSSVELAYVSVGCNRGVHVADWNREVGPGGGLLAFGAHDTVAVYDPVGARIVRTLRGGHADRVTAVRWLECDAQPGRWLISAGADGAVCLWHRDDAPSADPGAPPASAIHPAAHSWRVVARGAHEGPVTDVRALRLRPDSEQQHPHATRPDVRLIVTVAQDCRVRLWRADLHLAEGDSSDPDARARAEEVRPDAGSDGGSNPAGGRFLRPAGKFSLPLKSAPLTAATAYLPGTNRVVLAVGCADGVVRAHVCDVAPLLHPAAAAAAAATTPARVEAVATLEGHSDWVRDLAFAESRAGDGDAGSGHLLLATASQDKTARVWRVAFDAEEKEDEAPAFARLAAPRAPPSRILGGVGRVATRLEALLQGHEDWALSVSWRPRADPSEPLELLTASMDRSLILWRPSDTTAVGHGSCGSAGRDGTGGEDVWMAVASMGEAAASCLGFYGASFDASGDDIIANGHGGALHRWRREGVGGDWIPAPACSGHVDDVSCLSWDAAGRYLLTGSGDLTTRLHASWDAEGAVASGWRQIARPQVHGHAVTCVAATPPARADRADAGSTTFVSGADEKTLRVFNAPGTFLGTLARSLSRADADAGGAAALEAAAAEAGDNAAGAELPQLGLSNKAIRTADGDAPTGDASTGDSPAAPAAAPAPDDDVVGSVTPATLSSAPLEEVLAQATLWPESRKLYGHGNDVACVASHPLGTLVASACKAQSAAAAEVWMWDSATDWRPLGSLPGATLTVVALRFAENRRRVAGGDLLLAASRDRHVALYVPPRDAPAGTWGEGWTLAARVKAHAKAIYDASWAPGDARVFATAARDKRVKVWAVEGDVREGDVRVAARATAELSFSAAATATAFARRRAHGRLVLAVGLEDGAIRILAGGMDGWTPAAEVPAADAHAGAVRALGWRPGKKDEDDDDEDDDAGTGGGMVLASASADHSVRLFVVR